MIPVVTGRVNRLHRQPVNTGSEYRALIVMLNMYVFSIDMKVARDGQGRTLYYRLIMKQDSSRKNRGKDIRTYFFR